MINRLYSFIILIIWALGIGCFGHLAYIGQWLFAFVDLALMYLSFDKAKKSFNILSNKE